MRMRLPWATIPLLFAALASAGMANADYALKYVVTITNVTRGQTFTPQLLVTHSRRISLFSLGRPASPALEILAEDGNTSPLTDRLLRKPDEIGSVQTLPDLLGPGESVTIAVQASRYHNYLSMAAMLIPTNDTFVALNRIPLPGWGRTTLTALAYDAGTEANDQNCLNIPGPRCGGEGFSRRPGEGDEGYVYVSNGFHTLPQADDGEVLGPQAYDWRNPVAQIVVKRIH